MAGRRDQEGMSPITFGGSPLGPNGVKIPFQYVTRLEVRQQPVAGFVVERSDLWIVGGIFAQRELFQRQFAGRSVDGNPPGPCE